MDFYYIVPYPKHLAKHQPLIMSLCKHRPPCVSLRRTNRKWNILLDVLPAGRIFPWSFKISLEGAGALQESPVCSITRPSLFCFAVNSEVKGTALQIQEDIEQAATVLPVDAQDVGFSWNAFSFRLVTFGKKCQRAGDGAPILMRPSVPSDETVSTICLKLGWISFSPFPSLYVSLFSF